MSALGQQQTVDSLSVQGPLWSVNRRLEDCTSAEPLVQSRLVRLVRHIVIKPNVR